VGSRQLDDLGCFLGKAERDLALSYVESLKPHLLTSVSGRGSEVARHTLSAGGRRLRAMVVLAMCEALGGRLEAALPGAVAIELVHTASLRHDDILDGSHVRRGREAAHAKFGMGLALLTGDMLCFTAVATAISHPRYVEIVNAACLSMCLGEVTENEIEAARLKSGSLFRAAAELGATAAEAPAETLAAAGRYGEQVGTVYQLRDNEIDDPENGFADCSLNGAEKLLEYLSEGTAKRLLLRLAEFAWRRSK